MLQSYQESVFFHYILSEPRFLNNTKPEFFSNPTLKELFGIAKEHTTQYKEAPSKDQLSELVKVRGLSDKINDDVIGALYNSLIKVKQYDKQWLEDNVGPWIKLRNLEYVMRKSIAYMKTSNLTVETAGEAVEKVRHMISSETAIDFSFKLGADFFDPKAHKQDRLARTSTGFPFIDLCLDGGWWKGSLICFLSGPKSGKSMWLGNLAAQSVYNGYNTAYITLELQKEIVSMRIGANMLSIPMDEYKEKAQDEDFMRRKLSTLKASSFKPLGNFHIQEFPSSTMSTNDLRTYLKKAEEVLGYKFENVFIDYINIMKNWRNPNTENLYMKIKQISEDLRAIAMEEQWAIITATQTNRGGWDTSDLSITNVSESAALLHTVDALFGIVINPEMKARGECYLKYLADRVSGMENTRKRFTFQRPFSRIEEDPNSQIEDLEYLFNSFVSGDDKKRRGGKPKNTHEKIEVKISQNVAEKEEQKPISLTGEPESPIDLLAGLEGLI